MIFLLHSFYYARSSIFSWVSLFKSNNCLRPSVFKITPLILITCTLHADYPSLKVLNVTKFTLSNIHDPYNCTRHPWWHLGKDGEIFSSGNCLIWGREREVKVTTTGISVRSPFKGRSHEKEGNRPQPMNPQTVGTSHLNPGLTGTEVQSLWKGAESIDWVHEKSGWRGNSQCEISKRYSGALKIHSYFWQPILLESAHLGPCVRVILQRSKMAGEPLTL